MVVAQIRDGLPVGAHGTKIAAHLGLGKDHSYIHRAILLSVGPVCPDDTRRRRV
jgi:hypothetical protein